MRYEIVNKMLYIAIIVLLYIIAYEYLSNGQLNDIITSPRWVLLSLGLIITGIGISINGGITWLLTSFTILMTLRIPNLYTFLILFIFSLALYKFKAARLINIPLHKPLYKYLVILTTAGFSIAYILIVRATEYGIPTILISFAVGLVTAFFTYMFYPSIATVIYTMYLYIYYPTQKSNTIHIHNFSYMVHRYKDNMLITPYIASISLSKESNAEDLNISAITYYFLKQGRPLTIIKYKTDGKGNYVFY
ncbi:hypothetical protein [Myroides sp. N17-2]|uniref:hypothetical protein n=1 Tax=Myroides sp. N17-2 TaxID=2030799 RepID=UPI000EFDA748|nr:hypothetical protein [Myroides sp. N17-2]